MIRKINLAQKFDLIQEQWSPRIAAQMNDTHIKLAKIQGEFVWHAHADSDEVFLVVYGAMEIHLRDGVLALQQGEMVVIPKGVEHKPVAEDECSILMVEGAGTVNTGDAGGEHTIESPAWI